MSGRASSAGSATRSRSRRRALTQQLAVAAFDPARRGGLGAARRGVDRGRRRRSGDRGDRPAARGARRSDHARPASRRGDRRAARGAGVARPLCSTDRGARRRRQRHRQDDHDRKARRQAGSSTTARSCSPQPTRSGRPPKSNSRSGRSVRAPTSSARRAAAIRPPLPTTRSRRPPHAAATSVIVDTAGRLHTQTNLMEELAKVRRVIAGRLEGAPHETLLVVDATTGQNGLQQARLFGEAVEVTGRRADEARRLRQGRDRRCDRARARPAGDARRRGGGARRPPPVRPGDFARALVSGELRPRGAEAGPGPRFSQAAAPVVRDASDCAGHSTWPGPCSAHAAIEAGTRYPRRTAT